MTILDSMRLRDHRPGHAASQPARPVRPAARPRGTPAPAEDQIAYLDVLADEVIARGWTAYITTPLGRPVRLFVQDPHDSAMCSYIMAAPDEGSGEWWYWFGWAERIARVGAAAAAADAIVRVLRRPAERA
jgi:hypothetical protein